MCKKICGAVFAIFAVALLSSGVLLAQGVKDVTLTDAEIQTFIKVAGSATDPVAMSKIIADSKLDPMKWASAQGKLSFILGIRAMGQGTDAEKAMLGGNPMFKFSDAELDLINKNEAALLAAYKTMTTPK
ncbi:MAG: hypothetical protein LBE01_05530 [Deltaproteobacteria bacterium]|jgi:hypothetical protein|nr:hypothetical protein [Deltaproteobacteria bacterium]